MSIRDDSLSVKLRIRLYASNLPKQGRLKNRIPSSYAVVTSIHPTVDDSRGHATSQTSLPEVDDSDLQGYKWGETELIEGRNPRWLKTILMDYQHGQDLHFFVHVFQSEKVQPPRRGSSSEMSIALDQGLGTAIFNVADILGARNNLKVKRLRSGGCLFCKIELVNENGSQHVVHLQVSAHSIILPNNLRRSLIVTNRFYKHPDLVLEIDKAEPTGSYATVYRSDRAVNTLEPSWDPFVTNFGVLCNSDRNRPLKFSIYLVKENGNRILVGICESTLAHILSSFSHCKDQLSSSGELVIASDFFHELQLQRNSTKLKDVGRLRFNHASVRKTDDDHDQKSDVDLGRSESSIMSEVVNLEALVPLVPGKTLSQYLKMGLGVSLTVAIDFSSSNGDPRKPSSLHYRGKSIFNDYEETIQSIGQALLEYDETKECTVYGFGAKFGGTLRHIFQCGSTPVVHGIDGIIGAYQSVLEGGLTMSGPTVYHQVVQAAAVKAKQSHDTMTQSSLRYHVLLLISDGNPEELEETKRKLQVYADLPLSVIIVGVGSRSNFSDVCSLAEGNANVTVAEFRKHQHKPSALSAASLGNLPDNVCRYLRDRGF